MKEIIIKKIYEYFYGVSALPEVYIIENIEKEIDEYHSINELYDEELVIYESLILLIPPLSDYIKSLKLLQVAKNYRTLILFAIIQYQNTGGIEEDCIEELKVLLDKEKKTNHKSIIYYLLALSSENREEKIEYLGKSIEYNLNNVLSFIELAIIYLDHREKEKSLMNFEKGFSNIKDIIKEGDKVDVADYNFFINESIIGNIVTEQVFEYWQELFQKVKIE
jgi:tetratricopeptide (TPR) repeat protein